MRNKRTLYFIFGLTLALLLVWQKTIDAGGDGKSYSIKSNNELVCAYSNGKDITDDIKNSEDKARTAIIKHYKNKEVEFLDFCHLGVTLDMTIDIMVDDGDYYTVSWIDAEIKVIRELDKDYAEFWYRMN